MNKGRTGFTLLELLVVIAIIALLAGITFSMIKNAGQGQRRFACLTNLHMLYTMLRQYQLDNLGYPPFDVALAQEQPAVGGSATETTGLWALFEAGAGDDPDDLHCPEGRREEALDSGGQRVKVSVGDYVSPGESFYYISYQALDPDFEEPVWEYLPFRGITEADVEAIRPPAGSTDEAAWQAYYELNDRYHRQLWPNAQGTGQQRWTPRKDTIITWCPHHRHGRAGGDNYVTLVLYLDGTVQAKYRFTEVDAADAPFYPREGEAAVGATPTPTP